jgi:hypothetical protein
VSFMPTKADTREEEPAIVLHEFTLGQNTRTRSPDVLISDFLCQPHVWLNGRLRM